jgi:hypothetical protein
VLLELGAAELRASLPGATDHLREAYALLQGHPRLVEATLALASALYSQGALYEATEVLQRTIESRDPGDVVLVQRLEAPPQDRPSRLMLNRRLLRTISSRLEPSARRCRMPGGPITERSVQTVAARPQRVS